MSATTEAQATAPPSAVAHATTAPTATTSPAITASALPPSDELPTAAILAKAAELPVLAADGSSKPFKSLYSGDDATKRVMIIFVRHFFCGACVDFVQSLSAAIKPSDLAALPEPTSIIIIGCGEASLIEKYAATTQSAYPIYADPSRALYTTLGMIRNLSSGDAPKPTYLKRSSTQIVMQSLVEILKSGRQMFSGGDKRQVGGEWLFDDAALRWCHRMRHPTDHTDIPELRTVLGVPAPAAAAAGETAIEETHEEEEAAPVVNPAESKETQI